MRGGVCGGGYEFAVVVSGCVVVRCWRYGREVSVLSWVCCGLWSWGTLWYGVCLKVAATTVVVIISLHDAPRILGCDAMARGWL